MTHSTRKQPAPGLIYQTGTGNSFTRIELNADLTITIEEGGTIRTFEAAVLADVLPMWAERCYKAARGEFSGLELGPVGLRMARKYAEKSGALGKKRAAAMHRALSRLGLPGTTHYQVAARALGRTVQSLATLTEDEARRAWYYARHNSSTATHAA